MKDKKRLFIYLGIFLFLIFIACPNVLADDKMAWLQYGETVSCGTITNIPVRVPNMVSSLINILNVAVPVILVIFGVIDLVKGMMSGKEDDIKKGQTTLIKRIILGACIFLIVIAVKFLVSVVDENQENQNNIISCINCFISGECSGAMSVPTTDPAEV